LCPELITNFEGFQETPEAATKEIIQLMNQLDLEVSTEDVDELIASHSQPMSNEELIAMQEANKAPREDQDDDEIIQSPPTKTLNVKNLNEAFTYLLKHSGRI
jgi:CHASE3 domain sensor protein